MSAPASDTAAPGWKLIGPGLLVAATGVGAADLVATLVAGQEYGYALLWTVIVGCIMKVVLVEGAGRYSLATGKTIFEGWRTLGIWTTFYFGPYIVIWGFIYGAAAMSGTGYALNELFGGLDVKWWGVIAGLLGLALVWFGKFSLFENVTTGLVGLMFLSMVGAAIMVTPNIPDLLAGLAPRIPEGGLVNVLGVAGGVGGTITLAAYGYWLREKGWTTPKFMRVMRIDNRMAYLMTGIFVVATLIVGAELLHASRLAGEVALDDDNQALAGLADVLGERYGTWATIVFLVGFFSAAMTSLIGVWNGVSLMFADFVGNLRKLPSDDPRTRSGGTYFKWYVLWLTFPPMIFVLGGQEPEAVLILYGVFGSFFMPFLAITLLVLLNTSRTPKEWRNKPFTNVVLGLVALAFVVLAYDSLSGELTFLPALF